MWIAIPFAVVEILIVTRGLQRFGLPLKPISFAERFETGVVTINITMAVFAINFSFVGYQFSPYRGALRRVSTRHLLAAALTLLLALVPITLLSLNWEWTGTVALAIAPVVAYLGILLSELPSIETTPERLAKRRAGKDAVQRLARQLLADSATQNFRAPELDQPVGDEFRVPPPMHEVSWRPTLDSPGDDPFAVLLGIATVALREGDVVAFQKVVECLLSNTHTFFRQTQEWQWKGVQGSPDSVRDYAVDALRRLVSISQGESTGVMATRFVDKSAVYLRDHPPVDLSTLEFSITVIDLMASIAKPWIGDHRATQVLTPLVCARRLGLSALTSPAQPSDGGLDIMYYTAIESLPNIIYSLGNVSIDRSDSNYLYRCLDACAWLGIAAVQSNRHRMGVACANALVQLGRRARATGLQCFWDGCAKAPPDHAWERLEWITSWTTHLDARAREYWGRTMGEAFSRLNGNQVHVEYEVGEDRVRYQVTTTDVPHVVGILDGRDEHEIDYSDPKQLKEYRLH